MEVSSRKRWARAGSAVTISTRRWSSRSMSAVSLATRRRERRCSIASSSSLDAFSVATLSSLTWRRTVSIAASCSIIGVCRCAGRVGMMATNDAIIRASSRSFLARIPLALANCRSLNGLSAAGSPATVCSTLALVMVLGGLKIPQIVPFTGSTHGFGTHMAFDNSYARLPERFFARLAPTPVPAPRLIRLNDDLARHLGIDPDRLAAPDGVEMLAGNRLPEGAEPLAMAYAGHQFGNWVPQLGDGRAVLLGEVHDRDGVRRDIQLKGAGRTPFSRMGDGRAALGPVLREYIVSEAMAALGIRTTRALAVAAHRSCARGF